jgi:hypothetical protein
MHTSWRSVSVTTLVAPSDSPCFHPPAIAAAKPGGAAWTECDGRFAIADATSATTATAPMMRSTFRLAFDFWRGIDETRVFGVGGA